MFVSRCITGLLVSLILAFPCRYTRADDPTVVKAGELSMVLAPGEEGITLRSLSDTAASRQLSPAESEPLFELTLRHAKTKEEVRSEGVSA